jgi:hypothetical protein
LLLSAESHGVGTDVRRVFPRDGGHRKAFLAVELEQVARSKIEARIEADLLIRHETNDTADTLRPNPTRPLYHQWSGASIEVSGAAAVEAIVTERPVRACELGRNDPDEEFALISCLNALTEMLEAALEFSEVGVVGPGCIHRDAA